MALTCACRVVLLDGQFGDKLDAPFVQCGIAAWAAGEPAGDAGGCSAVAAADELQQPLWDPPTAAAAEGAWRAGAGRQRRRVRVVHFQCSPATQLARLHARGAARDGAKLAAFEPYREAELAKHAAQLAAVRHLSVETEQPLGESVAQVLAYIQGQRV